MSVLIVDDSDDYAQVLRRILQNGMGYTSVVTVSSVQGAYDLISSAPEQFSLMFVDYHFPNGETGAQLVDRLRADKLWNNRIAFFITAEPSVQIATDATEHGIQGVVLKPFDREQLRRAIERVEKDIKMARASE